MNSNLELASKVIEELLKRGVNNFVICPGSFNSPFMAVLSKAQGVTTYNHFEERAAAFFSLGLSKQLHSPVCVCVTSGTAVAECLPAVIEAFYAENQLFVLSADRESSLSGSGFPQAINQANLLSSHTSHSIDIRSASDLSLLPLEPNLPIHCNVRFSEPILSPGFSPIQPISNAKIPSKSQEQKQKSDSITSFLSRFKKPLVILESIPAALQKDIKNFLKYLGAPIIIEARSGLREDSELNHLAVKAPTITLANADFDCVLRIGSVPSLEFWRALERDPRFNKIPVCSLTNAAKYPGLSRESLCLDLNTELFKCEYSVAGSSWSNSILSLDKDIYEKTQNLLTKYSRSEPALVNWYSSQIPAQSFVYLGNSLPIREWNDFADRSDKNLLIDANRGANGIDGQIATFFGAGLAAGKNKNFALLGDLTFLYDCNSLTMVTQFSELNFCLGIINNAGGKIFEKLPYFQDLVINSVNSDQFLNLHKFDLSAIAKGFGLEAIKIIEPGLPTELPNQVVLEIIPDEKETKAFSEEYASIAP